jgi:hypothetical protein
MGMRCSFLKKQVNHIKDIALKAMSKTPKIRIPKNEPVVIDTPALYALFNIGEENRLKDNLEVFITFTAIEFARAIKQVKENNDGNS